jgi:hypothetical protein
MASQLPPPAAIEVCDEGEKTVGGRMDVGRQGGDLLLQLLQRLGILEGRGYGGAEVGRFGGRGRDLLLRLRDQGDLGG